MKSIAGSIVTLGGAILMTFNSNIPAAPMETISSLAMIVIGIVIIFKDKQK